MTERPKARAAAWTALLGGSAAVAGLGVWALGVEPYRLQVERVTLCLPRLPAALDGVSVLLLADLHLAKWGRRERLLAGLLDRLPAPDIAVLAGDLLQGENGLTATAELIAQHVRARAATFATWGNAEHKPKQAIRDAFRARLEAAGVQVLVNENRPLALCGETITVAGTDDPYYGHADVAGALAGRDPGRFCLLVAHSPQVVLQAARQNVDLMLSGHTHGGQVRLPFIGALKTQNPLSDKVDMGLFDRARLARIFGPQRYPAASDLLLYVTRGVGVARFKALPLYPRFLCPPEITWITLRRRWPESSVVAP